MCGSNLGEKEMHYTLKCVAGANTLRFGLFKKKSTVLDGPVANGVVQ